MLIIPHKMRLSTNTGTNINIGLSTLPFELRHWCVNKSHVIFSHNMAISSWNSPMQGKSRGRLFLSSIRFVILFHGSDISKALHIAEPDTIIGVGECWKLRAGNAIIEADFASVSETFVFSYSVTLYVVIHIMVGILCSRLRVWGSHGLTQFVRYAVFYEQTPC